MSQGPVSGINEADFLHCLSQGPLSGINGNGLHTSSAQLLVLRRDKYDQLVESGVFERNSSKFISDVKTSRKAPRKEDELNVRINMGPILPPGNSSADSSEGTLPRVMLKARYLKLRNVSRGRADYQTCVASIIDGLNPILGAVWDKKSVFATSKVRDPLNVTLDEYIQLASLAEEATRKMEELAISFKEICSSDEYQCTLEAATNELLRREGLEGGKSKTIEDTLRKRVMTTSKVLSFDKDGNNLISFQEFWDLVESVESSKAMETEAREQKRLTQRATAATELARRRAQVEKRKKLAEKIEPVDQVSEGIGNHVKIRKKLAEKVEPVDQVSEGIGNHIKIHAVHDEIQIKDFASH